MNELRLKQLNQQNGWTYGRPPDDGVRYWTAVSGARDPIILTSDITAEKGWSYEDGEHVGFEVVAYKAIPVPLFKV